MEPNVLLFTIQYLFVGTLASVTVLLALFGIFNRSFQKISKGKL